MIAGIEMILHDFETINNLMEDNTKKLFENLDDRPKLLFIYKHFLK